MVESVDRGPPFCFGIYYHWLPSSYWTHTGSRVLLVCACRLLACMSQCSGGIWYLTCHFPFWFKERIDRTEVVCSHHVQNLVSVMFKILFPCPLLSCCVIHHFLVYPDTNLCCWQLKSSPRISHSDCFTVCRSWVGWTIMSSVCGATALQSFLYVTCTQRCKICSLQTGPFRRTHTILVPMCPESRIFAVILEDSMIATPVTGSLHFLYSSNFYGVLCTGTVSIVCLWIVLLLGCCVDRSDPVYRSSVPCSSGIDHLRTTNSSMFQMFHVPIFTW